MVALAATVSPGGEEKPEVELVEVEVVGDELRPMQCGFLAVWAVLCLRRVSSGCLREFASCQRDRRIDVEFYESAHLGIRERDRLDGDIERKKVPVLEFAFDVGRAERDSCLTQTQRGQIRVGEVGKA